MDDQTRREVLDLINDVMLYKISLKEDGKTYDSSKLYNLENELYGLFDGYLYEDLQLNALECSTELASRITRVYDICNRYPKVQNPIHNF
tara:strand:- start:10832 stop:11101 length:270 start_codon:yes stop_codon:yes gene_type:complete